uniref:DUF7041 domain-containing protein n=1 Tax=Bombyx mori TaxID=7091 RepID=A0A8R2R7N1_BOMMO|nr:uncharacterized protein LOC101744209 [Bombyx mori]
MSYESDINKSEVEQITVTSRIAEFWEDQPRTWFIHAESVLFNQKLSDDAKYHLVIAKLGKNVVSQVTDILIKPPKEKKYDTLKARLLAIYEESESHQLQKLIGEMELGDQKPSQLLRRMKDLARDKISDETLLLLWQNHLPTSVRAVLVVTDSKDINTLASVADKVMETTRPISIGEVNTADTATLISQIARINIRLDEIQSQRNGQRRERYRYGFRGRYANRARSSSRGRRNTTPHRSAARDDWMCFYHYRFKEQAHKCVPPCAWEKKQNQSGN